MKKENARILLVEDEPSLRFVAERQFKALGFTVSDTAVDGQIAVDKAVQENFDLIFMDLRLPNMDGITATRLIRTAGVKSVIIGMTAFAERDGCLAAGMDDFLQKPVLLQQLSDALEKWMDDDRLKSRIPREPASTAEHDSISEKRNAMLNNRIVELRRRAGLQ